MPLTEEEEADGTGGPHPAQPHRHDQHRWGNLWQRQRGVTPLGGVCDREAHSRAVLIACNAAKTEWLKRSCCDRSGPATEFAIPFKID